MRTLTSLSNLPHQWQAQEMTCIRLRYLLRLTRPNRRQHLRLPRESCRTSSCERCDGALLLCASDDRSSTQS
jgi:hypothetical protein